MMKIKYGIVTLLVCTMGIGACFDDTSSLGNKALSEIAVSAPYDTLTVYFDEELVLADLMVEQSAKKLPLIYEWAYGNLNVVDGKVRPYPIKDSLRVVSDDPAIRYTFREVGTYGLRLKVDNGESVCFKYFILHVDTRFAEGVTILSRDNRGKGQLSFMKTLSREEIGAGEKPAFRTDIMAYINPTVELEEVTDMIQAKNRLLICSGQSGRIYNMDARTFDLESMTSFKENYPACSFKNLMGITTRNSMYLSSGDKKAYVYDFSLNELILTSYAEAYELDGVAVGVRPIFVDYNRSVLYSPGTSGDFYHSGEFYTSFDIRGVCYVGSALYVIATYKMMPNMIFLSRTSWSFRAPDILKFDTGPDPLPVDRNSILVGSLAYDRIYFTYGNEIYCWEVTKMLSDKPVISVPEGMTITAMAMDPQGKCLYVGLYEEGSPAALKGHLFEYDAKTYSCVGEYRHVADKPIKIVYKTRE